METKNLLVRPHTVGTAVSAQLQKSLKDQSLRVCLCECNHACVRFVTDNSGEDAETFAISASIALDAQISSVLHKHDSSELRCEGLN